MNQKIIDFEKWLAEYEGDDKIISSREMKKILDETPKKEYNFESGIPTLNKLLDGFETGELITISGDTRTGKTLFCKGLTIDFEKKGLKCLWFNYENSARVFFSGFRPDNLPLFYMPKTLANKDIDWVEKRIWESKIKYDTRVIFIDHLGFLSDMEKNKDKRSEIDSLVRKIKTLSIKHNILIFLLWHIRKQSEWRKNYQPTTDDLKDSSSVAQDSDVVLMMQRLEEKGDYDVGKARIIVEKSRRAGTMRKSVSLQLKNGFFTEADFREEYGKEDERLDQEMLEKIMK